MTKIKDAISKAKNILGFCGCGGCWHRSIAKLSIGDVSADVCEKCLEKLMEATNDR